MTTTFEATPVTEPAPEPKPKKGKKAKKPVPASVTPASEPVQEPTSEPATEQPATEPSKPAKRAKPKKVAKGLAPEMTLADLADHYLAHLEATKSAGTALSYKMELDRAVEFLGADTTIGSLTPDDVRRFNASKIVMCKKDGKAKAQPSYLKTQRVLRLALVWAANDRKWLESAPIPVETAESK
jgi:hypothetical protein